MTSINILKGWNLQREGEGGVQFVPSPALYNLMDGWKAAFMGIYMFGRGRV